MVIKVLKREMGRKHFNVQKNAGWDGNHLIFANYKKAYGTRVYKAKKTWDGEKSF
jgi:hypothetical protein